MKNASASRRYIPRQEETYLTRQRVSIYQLSLNARRFYYYSSCARLYFDFDA